MPIHNEEDLLTYSLPSIYRLKPNETILLFDRCTDKSLEIAEKITKYYNMSSQTKFITINEPIPDWKFRVAYIRRYAYKLAKNPIILNTSADIILDDKILDHMNSINKKNIGMLLFGFIPYPRTFRSFIGNLVSHLAPKGFGFGGIVAFKKREWIETENQDDVKKISRCEDSHLYSSISKKYDVLFINTKTIHLRPRETKRLHFLKGKNRWHQKRTPFWEVVIHSLIYLRPYVLSGYLYARINDPEVTS